MGKKEDVYIIIDPFNAYAYELMQWAFLDFGLRAVVLIEDLYGSLYKKLYSPEIPKAWVAQSFLCERRDAAKLSEEISKNYFVKGIMPWSETTVELAIDLLKHLQCDWISHDILSRFRNKYLLKDFLRKQHPEIRMNRSWMIQNATEVRSIKGQLTSQFVIKPLDGMSNKKIGFFNEKSSVGEIEAYFEKSGPGRYVAEEFIKGSEFAVNGQADEQGQPSIYSVLKYHHKHVNGRPNVYTRSQHVSRQDPVFNSLASYAESVVRALGLTRCPFHAEIRVDPEKGPCLIEIAARPVGNQLMQMMRDAHGQSFEPLRIACHYYLSSSPFSQPVLNWNLYDKTQAINVDGITSKEGLLADLGDYHLVERSAFFKRWVVKPEIGTVLGATQDLLSQPFSFHIVSSDPDQDLMSEADRLESFIHIKTHDGSLLKKFVAHLTLWKRRVRMRFELIRFKKELRLP